MQLIYRAIFSTLFSFSNTVEILTKNPEDAVLITFFQSPFYFYSTNNLGERCHQPNYSDWAEE
jgi:hypothetical protein